MTNIKQAIYTALSTDPTLISLVGDRVHTWADDKDIRDGTGDIFPLITYQRVTSSRIHSISGVRVEFFQISAWAESMMQAEDISNAIVELFNRTIGQSWKSATLTGVNDSHDPQTKTYGVHARFSFVVYDPSY